MRAALVLLAAVTAAAAALVAGSRTGMSLRWRAGALGLSATDPTGPSRRRTGERPTDGRWALAGAAGLGGVALLSVVAMLPGTVLAVLAVLAVAGAATGRLATRAREQRAAEERRRRVADYCEALLGELRAGVPVATAVERSVDAWPATATVAATARLGADVPEALRTLGARAGAAGLVRLAATWDLCATTGAGLTRALERLLETVRTEEALHRRVRGELASARATARLVGVLPVVVLLAAQGIGGDPWQFLLRTPAGVGCLALGVLLVLAGLAWIDRIAGEAGRGV